MVDASGRFCRWTGIGLLALFSVFAAVFVIGETMSDPGGIRGLALTAAWLVPAILLAIIAWRAPDVAARWFLIVLAGIVALDLWAAFAEGSWRSFEQDVGPVRAIAAFAFAAVLLPLAVKRPAGAGLMLVVLGVAPVALAGMGAARSSPLAAVSVPIIVAGALLLVAAAIDHRPRHHPAPGRPQTPPPSSVASRA